MIKGSKINQLVLQGLLAEDKTLFLERLSIIISRNSSEMLEQLAEGVLISAQITDMEAAKSWLHEHNKEWDITEITSVEVGKDPNCVCLRYKYQRLNSKWFATEEKANRYKRGYSEDGVSQRDVEHPYEARYESSSSDSVRWEDKTWLKVERL